MFRQCAYCSNNEIVAVIWEGEEDSPVLQNHLRQIVFNLKQTLASVGLEDVVIKGHGNLAVVPDKFDCDFYDYCNAEANSNGRVINKYVGEFMEQYSWAEFIKFPLNADRMQ